MSTRKLKLITTTAAACALSLVSAAALSADRMHGGGQGAAGASRVSAPATHTMERSTMRQDTMTNASRLSTTPTGTTTSATTTTSPTATAAKPTTPAAKATTTAHATGQPNASCEDIPNQPGHSISAPGSAFNPDGVSGTHYAGEQPQNSKNPVSVSQYDVACARPHH